MREPSFIGVLLLTLLTGSAIRAAAAGPRDQAGQAPPAGEVEAGKPAGAAAVDAKSYLIGPEDLLLIRVWREPELSGQFPVRPDGRISLPLVNEMPAAGSTPQELADAIAKSLAKYMTQPEVSVSVLQVNSKKYFIIGEVNKPGSYPLVVPTTALEALVNAGGFRDFRQPEENRDSA